VPPAEADKILKGLKRAGIPASIIGRVTTRRQGIKIVENGKKYPLPLFEQDEITRVL